MSCRRNHIGLHRHLMHVRQLGVVAGMRASTRSTLASRPPLLVVVVGGVGDGIERPPLLLYSFIHQRKQSFHRPIIRFGAGV